MNKYHLGKADLDAIREGFDKEAKALASKLTKEAKAASNQIAALIKDAKTSHDHKGAMARYLAAKKHGGRHTLKHRKSGRRTRRR